MSFKVNNGPNRYTEILACGDRKDAGNFNTYQIVGKEGAQFAGQLAVIVFQDGPVKEAGVNGVFMEDLIDICIHRLTCFQTGPYACEENNQALVFLHAAKASLDKRTENRRMRGVEGTSAI